MDIFFTDPDDIPVEPDKIKIRSLLIEPYPDGRRVKINLEISPFTFKPNIEVNIKNHEGLLVGSLSIVETMVNKMEFTLHLREKNTIGEYEVKVILFYNDLNQFDLGERDSAPAEEIMEKTRKEVTSFESRFTITE